MFKLQVLLDSGADPFALCSGNASKGERDQLSAFEILLTNNPEGAKVLLDHLLTLEGKESQLLVFNLELFDQEGGSIDGAEANEMMAHAKMASQITERVEKLCYNQFQPQAYLHLNQLLRHPLSEAYLHLKWTLTRSYFYMNVVFFFLFTVVLTTLACYNTYLVTHCNNSIRKEKAKHEDIIFFPGLSRQFHICRSLLCPMGAYFQTRLVGG